MNAPEVVSKTALHAIGRVANNSNTLNNPYPEEYREK